MTSTNGVPPQALPVAAAPLPRPATSAKGQGGDASPPAQGKDFQGKDFAALLSQVVEEAAAAVGGFPQAEAGGAGEGDGVQPRPIVRTTSRARALRAEETLPPELLATLYPQMMAQATVTLTVAYQATTLIPPNPQLAALAPPLAGATMSGIQPDGEGAAPLPQLAAPPLALPGHAAPGEAFMPQVPGLATPAPASPGALQPQSQPAMSQQLSTLQALPQAAPAPAAAAAAPQPATPPGPGIEQAIAQQMPRADTPAVSKAAFVPQPGPEARDAGEGRAPAPLAEDALATAVAKAETGQRPPPLPAEQARKTELTVTRQETFLPTAGQPPLAHQAAEKIIAELQGAQGPGATDSATSQRAVPPGPARVLHIQLQPPEFGTLTVRLSLRDNALDIQMEAADQRTVRMIEADRDRLSDMLRSAGFALDALTVQTQSGDRAAAAVPAFTAASPDGGAPSGGGAQPGGAQADGTQSDAQRGQGSRGRPDQNGTSTGPGEDSNHAHPARSAGGDLYI